MDSCVEFDPALLVPKQEIRDLCLQNRCGHFNSHYMCPPHIGSIEEIKDKLRPYWYGVLLQHSQPLNVKNDMEGLIRSKLDFHIMMLQIEDHCRNLIDQAGGNAEDVWGFIGGTCELCRPCRAVSNEPCPCPERARTSLEALAIDVVHLMREHGLDCEFHPDRITWTGALLLRDLL
jgi:predicted metal-binding protein